MRNRRRVKIRRARKRVLALMVLLVAGGVRLVAFGLGQVRGSTAGRYIDPSLRPNDPGYAAFVTPTPTLLVVQKGADGQLAGELALGRHAPSGRQHAGLDRAAQGVCETPGQRAVPNRRPPLE